MIAAIADTVMSKSFLSSFADAVAAVSDSTPQSIDQFVTKYAPSLAVPNAVRDVKNMTDPVQRYVTNIVDEMKARTPGLSATLPPRRDAWGRPISYQSGFGSAYDAMSPFYVSKDNAQPIDLAMQKDGWYVGMPAKQVTINGERVSLAERPEIYSRYLELQGQATPTAMGKGSAGDRVSRATERLKSRYGDRNLLDTLNAVVAGKADELSDRYKRLTNTEDREQFLRKIVFDYRAAAREVLVATYPELTTRATAQMKIRDDREENPVGWNY